MRTLNTTVSTAIRKDTTSPVYLLRMGFSEEVRAATWATDIPWNAETWLASGIEVTNLTATGARLKMPNGGPNTDPWLALILNEGTRGRSISIYQHYTDSTASPQADAVLVFTGIMDDVTITDSIRVTVIENSQAKGFPPDPIDFPVFNYLLDPGDRIAWGNDEIVVT